MDSTPRRVAPVPLDRSWLPAARRAKLDGMAARYARFVRSTRTPAEQAEVDVVDGIAARLAEYLAGHAVEIDDVLHLRARGPEHVDVVDLDGVHVFRASSAKVQDVVGGLLREVGFREEVVHTPQAGFVTRSRADFAYRLGEGRGVIAEIERGGTTTNNHDLKDFWKVHIAADAHHLFLVVP